MKVEAELDLRELVRVVDSAGCVGGSSLGRGYGDNPAEWHQDSARAPGVWMVLKTCISDEHVKELRAAIRDRHVKDPFKTEGEKAVCHHDLPFPEWLAGEHPPLDHIEVQREASELRRKQAGVLEQDELWWDKEGLAHRVTEMEQSHRINTQKFLRRRINSLAMREYLRTMDFADMANGDMASLALETEAGHMLDLSMKGPEDLELVEWLEAKPLMRKFMELDGGQYPDRRRLSETQAPIEDLVTTHETWESEGDSDANELGDDEELHWPSGMDRYGSLD